MSKRMKVALAVVALAVVGGVVATVMLRADGSGPEVEKAIVTKQDLSVTVAASGKVERGVSADVFPPAAGTLETIYVEAGTTVTAGTRLASMDEQPFELQIAQARAGLSQAEALLANFDAQPGTTADITAAKTAERAAYKSYLAAKAALGAVSGQAPSAAQIAAAAAGTTAAYNAYTNAKLMYEAYPSSDATKVALGAGRDSSYAAYLGAKATQQQLESTNLTAARLQAQAGVEQAKAAWQAAQAQYGRSTSADRGAQRSAAEAGVEQAATALAVAQEALDDATLVAPIDGVVVFNSAASALGGQAPELSEGSVVSPQAAPFSVVDLNSLTFVAEVDEADISRVRAGMTASVSLDSFPAEEIVTSVTSIDPTARTTATGGTVFAVDLALSDPGKAILLGMKGDSTIQVSSRGSALTVPVEALFSEGGSDFVYLIRSGKLKRQSITIGATTDTEVEVLEGLSAGDDVALAGAAPYSDGMAIRVKR